MSLTAGLGRGMASVALLLLALAAPAPAVAAESRVLATLAGTVVEIGETAADLGEMAVDPGATAAEPRLPSLVFHLDRGEEGTVEIVVAPAAVLAEAGFELALGDRLEVRAFLDPAGGPALAQKVINRTRGLVVRLRTLHREPLWSGAGEWEGADPATRPAPPRQRPAQRPRPPVRDGSGG